MKDGREAELPIEEVRAGDLVRIRPGEQIPVDGVVVEGASAVDESLVTGEPIPREKLPGHQVIGGSLNHSGTLLRVNRGGEESFLQQVARHIQEARALKPGILLLLDRILKDFVPAVLMVAVAAFAFWTFGSLLIWGAPDWERAGLAALAVLVMGYPCALGMAAPLAMIRGGGEAARQGILMRSAASFQAFKDVSVVVLDKTGTITHGQPRVVDVFPADGGNEERLLSLAASAEQVSEHPLDQAAVKAARAKGLRLDRAESFEAVAGKGVRATVAGKPALVGTLRFLAESGVETESLSGVAAEREARAETVIAVASVLVSGRCPRSGDHEGPGDRDVRHVERPGDGPERHPLGQQLARIRRVDECFRGRPSRLPCACARLTPAIRRSRIRSRSNSAIATKTWNRSRPRRASASS